MARGFQARMEILERWVAQLEEDFFHHKEAMRRLVRRGKSENFRAFVKRNDLEAVIERVAAIERQLSTVKRR